MGFDARGQGIRWTRATCDAANICQHLLFAFGFLCSMFSPSHAFNLFMPLQKKRLYTRSQTANIMPVDRFVGTLGYSRYH